MELLKDWKFWTFLIAVSSFLFSIVNFIIQRIVSNKITNNDLKHLTKDVDNLKQENKEYKIGLKNELNKIFRRLGKIEKGLVKREAICELRHKND